MLGKTKLNQKLKQKKQKTFCGCLTMFVEQDKDLRFPARVQPVLEERRFLILSLSTEREIKTFEQKMQSSGLVEIHLMLRPGFGQNHAI